MNSLLDSHMYRLTHSVIVFGLAGLFFYIGMVIGSFAIKNGLSLLGLEKGLGF